MGKRADQGGWPPSEFGRHLRDQRERAGLSQAQLAEAAGCNRFTVAKLEGGRQEPAWPLAVILARALGLSVAAFEPPAEWPAVPIPDLQPKGRGRPARSTGAADETPNRPRGRPRKQAVATMPSAGEGPQDPGASQPVAPQPEPPKKIGGRVRNQEAEPAKAPARERA